MVYIYVCTPHACLEPAEVIRGFRLTGAGGIGILLCNDWELNQGPLQDQQVFSTAAPSLQPLSDLN